MDIPVALAKALEQGALDRSLVVQREAIDVEARTVTLAFASETPYPRYWGVEILDCTAPAIRQARLRSGANLLCDHDSKDVVGVVESVDIGADRVARAVVRFGKSARAEEVWGDVRDGIRRNVSVGYMIHKAQLVETKDEVDTYRVTDWEPFEVSLVSVPADPNVGVGRNLQPATKPIITTQEPAMSEPVITEKPAARNHAAEISKIAAGIPGGPEMAMKAIQEGLTVEQFQAEALRQLATKPVPTADVGMTPKETKRYSFVRAINALANPTDQRAQREAAFEIEASRAAAEVAGKQSQGLMVPNDVLKRDLTVGTTTAGGHTVSTDLLAQDFITLLRNAMVVSGLGTRFLTGLNGNIAIPRQTSGATAYWVAESAAPTESQQAFDQVTMQPRTVGAFTDISRKLLLQSSLDVEAFVRGDLAAILGLEIERVAINGSGTPPEPRGILNTGSIGDVAGGTNGLAPAWSHVVGLETLVAVANAAVGNLAYLTNAKVRGKTKTVEKASTTGLFLWDNSDFPLNGYRAAVSNAVPSNLTKGSSSGICSAIIFGNFADLIVGLWGGLDLMVDPYTGGTSGTVRVIALQDVDVAVRHAESFAAMKDALTT
jgi:HK97 family phage major capsid protein/HK97 family phage prohead protease